MNVLGFLKITAITLTLSSCSLLSTKIEPEPIVKIVTKEVLPPKPIIPEVDRIALKEIEWVIITKDNIDEVFNSIPSDESKVFFAITADGYEKISLNLSDVRALLEQQQAIISAYENLWDEK